LVVPWIGGRRGPGRKPEARKAVLAWLGGRQGGPPAGLRINALHSAAGQADLLALAQSTCSADFVMIPKLRHAAELRLLEQVLPPRAGFLFPLIESPDALEDAYQIAAHPRAECVLFGAVDFAAEAGCDTTWEALLYARSRLACACAAHGATLFDVPYLALDDAQGCEAETRRSRALGIRARCAIHPQTKLRPFTGRLRPAPKKLRTRAAWWRPTRAAGLANWMARWWNCPYSSGRNKCWPRLANTEEAEHGQVDEAGRRKPLPRDFRALLRAIHRGRHLRTPPRQNGHRV